MDELNGLRKKIDEIDSEILRLLNRRAETVISIGKIKENENVRFHSPEREREILDRLEKLNTGPFPNSAIKSVYREILSASLSLEQPLRVAYFGPKATFTHLAAMQQFGSSTEYIPEAGIKEVFDEVERENVDYGVVPIENSTEGVVSYTLDMFIDSGLKIAAEIMLEVVHNLLSKMDRRDKIYKVYSNPQAMAQCRRWVENNLKNISIVEASSTAKAAEMAADDPSSGAIASELAAKIYGLNILERRIEDNLNNYTRFLVISKKYPGKSGKDKTSIMFSIKDRVGALYSILRPFAEHQINLTKIESRPSKRKAWEYFFFVDMNGHIEDEDVRAAIDEVKDECLFLKVLGSYPQASD
ncbi:MAG: prephenate dehydratase [Nitrospirota bacterium]